MKPRTTLILGGVFFALLAYVYFGEMRRPPAPAANATPTPAPLLKVAADQVLGITVRGGDGETRLGRAQGGEWRLEAPVPGPADTERVSRFLDRVATLTPSRSLDEPGPLEDYGLAQPALEVTLALADGTTQVLEIGAANPLETAYYAQVQGQPGVHLVSMLLQESVREMLDTPPVPPTPTPTAEPTTVPTEEPTATPAS